MFSGQRHYPHVHSSLQRFSHAHPHLHITIKSVPGHQGLRGSSRSHELSRAKFTPRPCTLWPVLYDTQENRGQMYKERTALMLELLQGTTTLRSRCHRFNRLDAPLIRRAQTRSLLTLLYTHPIQELSADPLAYTAQPIPLTHKACGTAPLHNPPSSPDPRFYSNRRPP